MRTSRSGTYAPTRSALVTSMRITGSSTLPNRSPRNRLALSWEGMLRSERLSRATSHRPLGFRSPPNAGDVRGILAVWVETRRQRSGGHKVIMGSGLERSRHKADLRRGLAHANLVRACFLCERADLRRVRRVEPSRLKERLEPLNEVVLRHRDACRAEVALQLRPRLRERHRGRVAGHAVESVLHVFVGGDTAARRVNEQVRRDGLRVEQRNDLCGVRGDLPVPGAER